MDKYDFSKGSIEESLDLSLKNIKTNFMKIYDHSCSDNKNLDDTYLKDLFEIIECISSIYSVYTINFEIDSTFVLEIIQNMKFSINSKKFYFESKRRSVEYEQITRFKK